MLGYRPLQEVQQCRVVDRLGIYELQTSSEVMTSWYALPCLVDAADTEAKSASFDASAVHVISDQEYELRNINLRNTLHKREDLTLSNSLKCVACKSA